MGSKPPLDTERPLAFTVLTSEARHRGEIRENELRKSAETFLREHLTCALIFEDESFRCMQGTPSEVMLQCVAVLLFE